MKYIVHRRYKGPAADGSPLNIPYGTEVESIGDFIATQEGKCICCIGSDVAQKHFSYNDDGRGLERGALTYAIAFSARNEGQGFRFSNKERAFIKHDYEKFLKKDIDMILFNESFFSASIDELSKLADALKIVVKK